MKSTDRRALVESEVNNITNRIQNARMSMSTSACERENRRLQAAHVGKILADECLACLLNVEQVGDAPTPQINA